jgi:hypothetical protein
MGNIVDNLETGEDVIKLVKAADPKMVYMVFCGPGDS